VKPGIFSIFRISAVSAPKTMGQINALRDNSRNRANGKIFPVKSVEPGIKCVAQAPTKNKKEIHSLAGEIYTTQFEVHLTAGNRRL
jgi:hypothetical protein